MFEGLKDVGKLMKQAKEMKSQMKKVQDELKQVVVTGAAMGGKIEVTMTGELECTSVLIDSALLDPKQGPLLQKALKEAINGSAKKAKDIATQKLSVISGGLNLPGL
ncbi:YbaB/EbfC family nucleoid-associated protein [bacterium]|nr:YbaB/EbfC family nucleoid-associated protein [bacterium]